MNVQVTFEEISATFEAKFLEEDENFSGDFGTLQKISPDEIPPYKGPYEVLPALESQVMETASKRMVQDATILPIPIYRVSNNSGGTTVTIG